jgi:hypothetical protein
MIFKFRNITIDKEYLDGLNYYMNNKYLYYKYKLLKFINNNIFKINYRDIIFKKNVNQLYLRGFENQRGYNDDEIKLMNFKYKMQDGTKRDLRTFAKVIIWHNKDGKIPDDKIDEYIDYLFLYNRTTQAES